MATQDVIVLALGLLLLAFVLAIITVVVWWYVNRANQNADLDDAIKHLEPLETADERYRALDNIYLQYINENLKRGKSIFRLTYLIIILGFILIVIGVLIAFVPTMQLGDRIIDQGSSALAASLSVLAGLVINFIATIILAVFRSSNRQNTEYFYSVKESLERQAAFDILGRIEKSQDKNAPEAILAAQLEVMKLVFGGDNVSLK